MLVEITAASYEEFIRVVRKYMDDKAFTLDDIDDVITFLHKSMTPLQSAVETATELRSFLKAHAKKMQDGVEYNSPDAYAFEVAANELEGFGHVSRLPNSEWGSGGYAPYNDKAAREWHDRLIIRCKRFLKGV